MLVERAHQITVSAAFVLLVAWILFASSVVSPYQCVTEQGAYGTHNKANEILQAEKADDRIARYTLWLAILTGGLVVVSAIQIRFLIRADKIAKISADAAVLNAKAAIGVELPIIIFELELHRESGTTGIVTDAPGKLSILKILYKNMGRSAAEMLRLCVEWRVIDTLPERAVFERMIDFAPGSMLDSAVAEQTIPMELQGAEVAAIKNKTKSLWVYGFLRYKDFIGDQHQTPYCARWDLGTKRFIYDPNIPSAYIQKT